MNVFTTKQDKNEFLDRFQERFNVIIEAAEGYGCHFGCEEVLWDTDDCWNQLSNAERETQNEKDGVKARCREGLLAYGFTSCLGERFSMYKKSLKADYAQGNNRYKPTVVESYQMALDVMRIYQKNPRNTQKKRTQVMVKINKRKGQHLYRKTRKQGIVSSVVLKIIRVVPVII